MSKLRFKNYGGSYQFKIQDAQDLEKVQFLDEVYWAATSIPIDSLDCDPALAAYLDTDKNHRIRSGEFKAALAWVFRLLANRSRLSQGTDVLRLGDINADDPEGQKLLDAAKLILTNLNTPDATEINLVQVRDVQSIMARAANNGDGIIPPDASSSPDLNQFIAVVMETIGSALDACGKPGINQKQLEEFFKETEAYLEWKTRGEIPPGREATEVMPWGIDTPQAFELVAGWGEKIEQFFTQCLMVKFDERTAEQMQLRRPELEEINFSDKAVMEARLKASPLALPNPEGILDLQTKINPLYAAPLQELQTKVLDRALGGPGKPLTEKAWGQVKDIFGPYQTWRKNKPSTRIDKIEAEKLRAYLKGPFREQITQLIAQDLKVADELNQLHNLEKLMLYQRWLLEMANNLVSFANIYNPQQRSLFERGTLIIDGREITFTMKVQDRQAHKSIAERSYMYLLYVEITGRQDQDIKFEIMASVTSGNADGLHVGKRGIFFTLDGREWDAQVVDIIVNPISPWESVKAPFQKIVDFVKNQIEKVTKSGQAKLDKNLSSSDTTGTIRNLLLVGGVTIAALGSAFAYITKALSQVRINHILVALLGVTAAILVPGIIAGFSKIRKRNMSVLLEASGWAVNAHMRLNAALGRLFTHTPRLPKGSYKERKDVVAQFVKQFGYTPRGSKRLTTLVLIIMLMIIGLIILLLVRPDFISVIAGHTDVGGV
jgi:hypothetical protein